MYQMTATIEFNGETVIVLGQHHYLVGSWTFPGEFYAVSDGECTCRGFECLKRCRHLAAISALERAAYENSPYICSENDS